MMYQDGLAMDILCMQLSYKNSLWIILRFLILKQEHILKSKEVILKVMVALAVAIF